ncbi:hypothetical protein VNO80_00888 [Phaseolus coccineus]|uniref:C2 domain-containing protein n=1 Tax=Phaseolus coccineus TaxID=3886 RepID=A0AAN9RRB7_PHACN
MVLLADAAVGAVVGELLKAVLEIKDKAIMFKQTLVNLQSTLIAIAPVIREMEQHNIELGHPKEELESLLRQMEDGTKLVCKCSQIHRLNYVARARYQDKLEALVDSLVRFFIVDMQAQSARDQKETLLKVRRIYSAVNRLTLGTVGASSRSNVVPRSGELAESEIDESEYEDALSVISDIDASSRSLLCDSDPVPDDVYELDTPFSTQPAGNYASGSNSTGHQVAQSEFADSASSKQRVSSVLLLHGNLDIWVHGAENLPNMEMVSLKIPIDPYVTISLSAAVIGRTFVISNSQNPVWEQHFYVPVAHQVAEVHFVVKDNDVVGSQLIGIVAIPVEQIYSGEKVQGTYPILNFNGKPCKPGAVLRFSIQYIPMELLVIYHQGVGAGPDYLGVTGTYFPLRKGGTVTLYQDAHVPDGNLPNVVLNHGMYYAHGKCWIDIFAAINQA